MDKNTKLKKLGLTLKYLAFTEIAFVVVSVILAIVIFILTFSYVATDGKGPDLTSGSALYIMGIVGIVLSVIVNLVYIGAGIVSAMIASTTESSSTKKLAILSSVFSFLYLLSWISRLPIPNILESIFSIVMLAIYITSIVLAFKLSAQVIRIADANQSNQSGGYYNQTDNNSSYKEPSTTVPVY